MTGSCALNITFKNINYDGKQKTPSPELQSWIIEAIEKGRAKGVSESDFCKNVSRYMNDNHGNYWNCFKSERFYLWGENDYAAYFDLDGIDRVVFKGRQ